jgi:hypothetical protein
MRNVLEMVQERLMFLLSSSAVLGTYSFPPPFLRPLFGMNSLTHSPLTAAISLKQGEIRVSMLRDMVYSLKQAQHRQGQHRYKGSIIRVNAIASSGQRHKGSGQRHQGQVSIIRFRSASSGSGQHHQVQVSIIRFRSTS